MKSQEKIFDGFTISGFLAIFIGVVLFVPFLFISSFEPGFYKMASIVILTFIPVVVKKGLIKLEPNEAIVLIFFGKYTGTFTANGFFWVNPFYSKHKISLRISNLSIDPVKVNDKRGNPIMIGAVLAWKIKDTYKAIFDIDNQSHDVMSAASNFVRVQSDAALRQIAGMYAYDNDSDNLLTLRSGDKEINRKLEEELSNRLAIAGIEIVEARINYLAYATEIAGVMLRRQQAEAIIAAREKLVEGAVGMVNLALNKLEKDGVVVFDEQYKATVTNNLLIILSANEAVHPV